MAAYGSSSTNAVTTGGSCTVTKPSGLAAGDLMVAFVSTGQSSANDTPSGWSSILSNIGDPGLYLDVFVKVASSGDAAASDFTFTHSSGSAAMQVVLYRITGTFTSSANVYAKVIQQPSEVATDIMRASTGITPSVASSLLIMHFHTVCSDSDNNSFSNYALETDNPTWTERHDIQDAGSSNVIRIGSATATRSATTDTGYFQAEVGSGNVSGLGNAALLAIADTQNGTPTINVIDATLAIQSPATTGGSQVTIANPVTISSSIPSATAAASDSPWTNTDKPSPGTITNADKP